MSNPGDDLNRLDLGLPEFQAAPSNEGDALGGSTYGTTAAEGEPTKANKAGTSSEPIAAKQSGTAAKAIPAATGSTKPTGPAVGASKGSPNAASNLTAKLSSTQVSGAGIGKPFDVAVGAQSARGALAGANDVQEAAAAESSHHFETARNRSWWSAAPSWAISTVIHVAAILVLAAWNIEPIQKELSLMLTVGEPAGDEANALEEFSIDNSMAELQSDTTEDAPSDAPAVETAMVEAKVEVDLSGVLAVSPAVTIPSASQSLAPSSGIAAQSSSAMRAALNSRSKETKREMLKKYGGTTETERAVAMALAWLAAHQNRETGAWTFAHSLVCGGQCDQPGDRPASMNAATGLALMCFLGAGQTHLEGEYKETVMGGLRFLIQNMRVQQMYGAWYRGDGNRDGQDDMYAHGIASIAMCEAYGMTRDQSLLEAAQLSINYLSYAQNPQTGGWHYAPFPLGNPPGDTSVVGWQMMAIKSGAMAGLNIDLDSVRRGNGFLDSMLVPGGFGYHYSMDSKLRNPTEYRAAMTACGVLCRMYSGWNKEEPTIKAAVARFVADGPKKNDSYYNYYATQVLKQYGGPEWEAWNTKMRDQIVSTQVQTGHAAGSWFGEEEHRAATEGGRLYCTCMATMMLEVYYRYMPLYAEQAEEDAFQL